MAKPIGFVEGSILAASFAALLALLEPRWQWLGPGPGAGLAALALVVCWSVARSALVFPERAPRCTAPVPTGGRLVTLSHGKCHYIFDGADNPGPLLVLVHGFVGSAAYLRWLATELATKHKRRVLRYDLYGRGWSDCSGAPHTKELFSGQLAELLFALGERDPIDLVGYSMGGAIASQFASVYGEKVRSLVLIAATGTRAMEPGLPPRFFVHLPWLPWLAARRMLTAESLGSLSGWQDSQRSHAAEYAAIESARATDEAEALARSVLLTLTHFTFGKQLEPAYAHLGTTKLPMLLIWGEKDESVPFSSTIWIQRLVPQAELISYPGGTHCLPIERYPEVAAAMAGWYTGASSALG